MKSGYSSSKSLTPLKEKKAYVDNSSHCYASRTDLDLITEFLKRNGWRIVSKVENADLVIINTCAYVRSKEDAALKMITDAQQKLKPGAQLVVTGCLPSINEGRLKKVFKGPAISAKHLYRLDDVLDATVKLREICLVKPSGDYAKSPGSDYFRPGCSLHEYRLRIGWGCYGRCSYCIIKRVFGKPNSRPVPAIVEEFVAATKKGFRKFVLVANEVGVFGGDGNTNYIELLGKLARYCTDAQFSISNITPDKLKETLPDLKGFIRANKIWRINVPVQSGSDRIIRLMNRRYSVADFKESIESILRIKPGLILETDIIVGFPSETQDDFQQTLLLTEWLGRYKVFSQIFAYDRRPGTAASMMARQVPEHIKRMRFRKLYYFCRTYFIMKNKTLFKKYYQRIV